MRSSTGRHGSVDLSACESSKPSAYGRSSATGDVTRIALGCFAQQSEGSRLVCMGNH